MAISKEIKNNGIPTRVGTEFIFLPEEGVSFYDKKGQNYLTLKYILEPNSQELEYIEASIYCARCKKRTKRKIYHKDLGNKFHRIWCNYCVRSPCRIFEITNNFSQFSYKDKYTSNKSLVLNETHKFPSARNNPSKKKSNISTNHISKRPQKPKQRKGFSMIHLRPLLKAKKYGKYDFWNKNKKVRIKIKRLRI